MSCACSRLFALEPTENSSLHHGFTSESRIFAGVSPVSAMALLSGHHFEFVDSTFKVSQDASACASRDSFPLIINGVQFIIILFKFKISLPSLDHTVN